MFDVLHFELFCIRIFIKFLDEINIFHIYILIYQKQKGTRGENVSKYFKWQWKVGRDGQNWKTILLLLTTCVLLPNKITHKLIIKPWKIPFLLLQRCEIAALVSSAIKPIVRQKELICQNSLWNHQFHKH